MKYIRSVQAVLNVTKGCIGRGLSFSIGLLAGQKRSILTYCLCLMQ